MPRFRFGLRARLATGFAVILLLSTATVALITWYAAEHEVDRAQHEQDRIRSNRIHVALADYYDSTGGWQNVDKFVSRISLQSERQIVVMDSAGRIIADSRKWSGKRFHFGDRTRALPLEYFTPISSGDVRVGSVAIAALRRGHIVPLLPGSHDPRAG